MQEGSCLADAYFKKESVKCKEFLIRGYGLRVRG
jgi:hypothetical protein